MGVRRQLRARGLRIPYFSYPPDVLVAVLLCEAEIFVQPKANIVAVQTVRGKAQVKQVLLKCGCNGRFTRRRQAGKPDGKALLLAVLVALVARERRMPCDVAVRRPVSNVCAAMAGYGGAHVAIVEAVATEPGTEELGMYEAAKCKSRV